MAPLTFNYIDQNSKPLSGVTMTILWSSGFLPTNVPPPSQGGPSNSAGTITIDPGFVLFSVSGFITATYEAFTIPVSQVSGAINYDNNSATYTITINTTAGSVMNTLLSEVENSAITIIIWVVLLALAIIIIYAALKVTGLWGPLKRAWHRFWSSGNNGSTTYSEQRPSRYV